MQIYKNNSLHLYNTTSGKKELFTPSEGFDLGFITLRFYSLMFVVAFGLGCLIHHS